MTMACRDRVLLLSLLVATNTIAALGFSSSLTPVTGWNVPRNGAAFRDEVAIPNYKLPVFGSAKFDEDTIVPCWNSFELNCFGEIFITASLIATMSMSALPDGAMAAGGNDIVVPSALVAYAHYAALLVSTAAIITERSTVSTNMSPDQENTLLYADLVNQMALLTIGWSGFLRVMEYGKGWEFYSHEPLFWVKVAFFGIVEATSLFPTIQIVQRSIAQRSAGVQRPPLSEALVARMKQLMNAELHSLLTIPLVATFMARGVFYIHDFPWQAGAALAAATFAGSTFRYSREALNWVDPSVSKRSPKESDTEAYIR